MSKQLPDRPNLDHLRKQAKDLLSALRKGDAEAASRIRALPGFKAGAKLALHDAQSVIAREYGFQSWIRNQQSRFDRTNRRRRVLKQRWHHVRLHTGERGWRSARRLRS